MQQGQSIPPILTSRTREWTINSLKKSGGFSSAISPLGRFAPSTKVEESERLRGKLEFFVRAGRGGGPCPLPPPSSSPAPVSRRR
ncbi:hypothetical protein Taro_024022 [Colocasia esculenta]|uniref:Uncharacterized protein n=1 Tax=Colocasia esculenta TaxID=4460 RepID=A0A843V5P5_COLES|nr:hypothetical protein [Colocasia esculenta]